MADLTADYSRLYDEAAARWPVVAATGAVLIGAIILPWLLGKDPLSKIPKVGEGHKQFMEKGAWETYSEGYRKVRVRPHPLSTSPALDSGTGAPHADKRKVQEWHLPGHHVQKYGIPEAVMRKSTDLTVRIPRCRRLRQVPGRAQEASRRRFELQQSRG